MLTFRSERMSWISPATLDQLVELKGSNPKAPLVLGNTNVGEETHTTSLAPNETNSNRKQE